MKILAVDHDPEAVRLTEQHCRAILANRFEQFTAANSLAAASAHLAATSFDAVLLDPPLPGGDGLDRIFHRDVPAHRTIIVSGRTDLALPAFDCGVVDFVPKPVERDRLARALRRVAPLPTTPAAETFIAVRRRGKIDFVPLTDLLYVEAADKYSELVLASGQRNFYDKNLGRVAATLPASFVRIHKSFLVRFPMVSRLIVLRGSRYFAELRDGQRLPVGRSHYEKIKARLL